jgi:hypothetical protein
VKALAAKLGDMSPIELTYAAKSVSNANGITEIQATVRVIFNIYRGASPRARVTIPK